MRLALSFAVLVQVALMAVASAGDPPPSALEAYRRGWEKSQAGDVVGALTDFTRAIEIDPGYAMAYYARAYVKDGLGDRDGAIADYTKAIGAEPRYKEA